MSSAATDCGTLRLPDGIARWMSSGAYHRHCLRSARTVDTTSHHNFWHDDWHDDWHMQMPSGVKLADVAFEDEDIGPRTWDVWKDET